MWVTKNGLGKEVVWYSEEEYLDLKAKLDNIKDMCDSSNKYYKPSDQLCNFIQQIYKILRGQYGLLYRRSRNND